MRYVISIALIFLALIGAVFGIMGFQGRVSHKPPVEIYSDWFMPGMDRQPKLRPQKPFPLMPNGVSSQLPPAGTVARNDPLPSLNGAVYRYEESPVNSGFVSGTTNFIPDNPMPINGPFLDRGHQRYDIYCSPCHGKLGDGNGITKAIGDMPAVANLHDERIIKMSDGEIYHTITYGKGVMGAYGPIVPVEDRWAIIAYLRALQLSQLGATNDLSAVQDSALNP